MKKLFFMAVGLFVCGTGYGNGNHEENSHDIQVPSVEQVSETSVFSESSASGGAGGNATGGSAVSTAGDSNASVGDITNSVNVDNPNKLRIKNTPDAYAGAAPGNAGASLALPGFGFGFNAPWGQEDRKKQGLAQQLWDMGNYAAARRVLCTTDRLTKALPEGVDCFESLGGDSIPAGK